MEAARSTGYWVGAGYQRWRAGEHTALDYGEALPAFSP
jgi:hypothetical protein